MDVLIPQLRKKCLNTLCKICGHQALLPRSVQIPLCYDRSGTPLYRGGFGDVWKGNYEGREVAVKVPRVYSTSPLDKITRVSDQCGNPSLDQRTDHDPCSRSVKRL